METVSCPRCRLSLLNESETAGQDVECPECKTRFKMPPMPPTSAVPPTPVIDAVSATAKRAKPQYGSFAWLQSYCNRAGWRSFVVQVALACWTIGIGLLFANVVLYVATPRRFDQLGVEKATDIVILFGMALVAGWFVVAFPLALTAICLFRSDRR